MRLVAPGAALGRAIAERPDLEPAEYSNRLQRERLKMLPEGEASIQVSYALLNAALQKQWRALGVFPETFDAPAAVGIWGVELEAARDALGSLLKYSMLDWTKTARRYRLHDLMRDFARARLHEAGEEDEAARRHATYYADVLAQADDLYQKGGDSIKPGLALFDLEWGNIQAGEAWAGAHAERDNGAARLCSGYASAGAYCLHLRLHPRERICWLEPALAAARRLGDRRAEYVHLGNSGYAYLDAGEYRRAIDCYEHALPIAHELVHQLREGPDLGNLGRDLGQLGRAYHGLGEYCRAVDYHNQALAIVRKIGSRQSEGNALRRSEGNALDDLGSAYNCLGEHRRAIKYHEQAHAIFREIRHPRGEGRVLCNLGKAYYSLGEYRRALEFHERQLTITGGIGDRQGEGNALSGLGVAHYSLGEYRRAIEYHEQHFAITREVGDRRGEGNALFNMSLALYKLGERAKAVEHAEAALRIFDQVEAPNAAEVRKQLEEWRKDRS